MANEFKVKNGIIISGSADIEQNLTVRGTLTADQYNVSIVSTSILYESGSTKFGDSLDDLHEFTGSVSITGSINLNGQPIGTGKLDESTFNSYTSSINTTIKSKLDSDNVISGSIQVNITGTTGYSAFSSSISNSFNSLSSSVSSSIGDLSSSVSLTTSNLSSSIGGLSSSIATTDLNQNNRLVSLETASGSIRTDFNTFTSSYTTVSSSLDSRLDVLEAYSGSQLVPSSSMSFRTLQTDVYCKNVTGVQINKGTVVRIVGATGDNPLVGLADYSTELNSANVLGIATENIPNGNFGLIITTGVLTGVNTQGMNAGDLLYLGANGIFTNVEPTAPNHLVRLGEVLRVQQNNGSINVRVDNGSELDEAHDVIYSSISHGDLLYRSGSVWKNSKALEGNYTVTGSLTITQNLRVLGSSSITYITASQLNVSSSTISVNVFEPAERFGGLKVYDSGSSNATASLLWDSEHNHWIYQNVSGSNYSGGMLLSGPRNTGSLGDEPGLINGRIVKSIGGDHLDVSIISETGTTITIAGDLVANSITGAFDFSSLINKPTLVSGSSQIDITGTTGYSTLSSSIATTTNVLDGRIDALETESGSIRNSFNSFTSSYNTGSFTGSFIGNGGGLYNIPASGVTGLQLNKIINGNASASIDDTGLYVNRDLYVDGIITAKEFHTDYVTSSVLFQSGSTKFGDDLLDTHTFTGSLSVSGSISVPGSGLVSGSSQISYAGLSNVPSGIISGSVQVISALPAGTVSGSSQVLAGTTIHSGSFFNGISVISGSAQIDVLSTTNIARIATTGSNTFTGIQNIGSSLSPTSGGDIITVFGSGSASDIKVFTTTNHATFFEANTNSGSIVTRLQSQNASFVGTLTNNTFDIVAGGNVIIRTTGSGLVGINKSTTPNATLDVNGNTLVTGSFTSTSTIQSNGGSIQTYNQTSGYGVGFYFPGSTTPSIFADNVLRIYQRVEVWGGTGGYYLDVRNSSGTQNIKFDGNGGNSFLNSGNFNIGYSSDQGAKLYVQANQASYAAYFEQIGGATSSYGGVRITTNSTGVNSLYIDNAGTQIFSVKGSGVAYVQNALGVGYSDPQYTLQVNGSIGLRANSQNIKAITGTGWGYSVSSYKVVMLGDTANNVTVSIGYDPSGNSNSAFTGDGREILFRNGASFATPNAANTSFNLNTLVMKDGKIGVGTDAPAYAVDVNGNIRINQSVAYLYFTSTTTNRYLAYNGADTYWRSDGVHYFEKTSGYKGSWDASGNLTVTGTITESSALRYKDKIETLENALDKILKLRGVSYIKKETGIKEFGLIAEETNEVAPELVLKNAEGEIESVAYGRINSLLIEAVKELKKEIEELKLNR